MKRYAALSVRQVNLFRQTVYHFFRDHGRDLPWRDTKDPYHILVSEIMLQQTQVSRVIEKYEQFIDTFPDIESVARVPLRDILAVWQGLGYNRRALALKNIAEILINNYKGKIPANGDALRALPGIGRTTAHAICVFAFNQPMVFIETNIRSVFIHHFFKDYSCVKDAEIFPFVEQTLDRKKPKIWYQALMDYGVALKKKYANPGKRSAHYQKQAPFKGSNRQIRGKIIQILMKKKQITESLLVKEVSFDKKLIKDNLRQMEKEGLVVTSGNSVSIA